MLIAGLIAGTSFAMAIDQIEPEATAQEPGSIAAQVEKAQARRLPTSQAEVILSYAPLVRETAPAVVNVYSARVSQARRSGDPFWDFFFGRGRMTPQPRIERSLGSGVMVDESGLVVTNNHVVAGADEVLVALADRREFPAEILFTDPQLDLALLQLDADGAELPAVELGDSDQAQVGDVVVAIGNPFGVGQTVTQGIISAVARTGIGISDYQFFLQTDAAINPGNSGGALLGMDGALVGINTAIYSRSGGSNGIGFAIPVNVVRQFLAGAESGRITRPWLGVDGQAVTSDLAASLGLDRPSGVVVRTVTPRSPGAEAGLRVGDVIMSVNGRDATDPNTLRYLTSTQPIGETVTLTVQRGDEVREVRLELVAPPEVPARDETVLGGNHLLTGVTVANLSPALSSELGGGLPEAGVVVIGVDRRSAAAQLGFLRPGDLIVSVNDRPAESVDTLASLMEDARAEAAIQINRGGTIGVCYFRAPSTFQCRS